MRGNKLRFSSNRGRGRGKRRALSSLDDSAAFKRLMKTMEKQQALNQMARMEEQEQSRADKQELRELQLQSMRAQLI
jgi:ribosomal protein L2